MRGACAHECVSGVCGDGGLNGGILLWDYQCCQRQMRKGTREEQRSSLACSVDGKHTVNTLTGREGGSVTGKGMRL